MAGIAEARMFLGPGSFCIVPRSGTGRPLQREPSAARQEVGLMFARPGDP